MINPIRGEVWWVNLEPTRGAELRKMRSAVILNSDAAGRMPLPLIVPLTRWSENYYNEMQVEQSHRQIYSSQEDFTLARKLCQQHPELCDPARTNVQVNELNIGGKEIIQAKNVGAILHRARCFQDLGS